MNLLKAQTLWRWMFLVAWCILVRPHVAEPSFATAADRAAQDPFSLPACLLHVTTDSWCFFFKSSNQVCKEKCMTSLLFLAVSIPKPASHQQAIWPDPFPAPEKCNMAGTWKNVLRHHLTSWELQKICRFSYNSFWAEAQVIFLTGMWPGFNSSLFWHMEKVHAGDILTICHVFASVWLTPDFVHIFAHSWGMAIYCFTHQT